MKSIIKDLIAIAGAVIFGFTVGYKYPRDVELESTKPIVLNYEITPEAARLLVLKSTEGLEVKP